VHFWAAATSFRDEIVPVQRFPAGAVATNATGRAARASERRILEYKDCDVQIENVVFLTRKDKNKRKERKKNRL
jgi:hypothetical protein